MWLTDSDGLDEQIDAAARTLTDGSPRADLKALVLARIDERGMCPSQAGRSGSIRSLDGMWSQSRLALIGTSLAVTAGIAMAILLHPSPPPPAPVVLSSATGGVSA